MSAFSEQVLVDRLTKLNPSQQSIQSTRTLALVHVCVCVCVCARYLLRPLAHSTPFRQLCRTGFCTIASSMSKWCRCG